MNQAHEVLETLYANKTITLAGGTEVTIKRVSPRTLSSVLGYIQSILASLDTGVEGETVDVLSPRFILNLISNKLDQTYGVAEMLCSLSYSELMDLELDEMITVIVAIVQENRRFFTERIQPLLDQAAELTTAK